MTLKEARKQSGLKANFIADKIGVSRRMLYYYENGKNTIPHEKLKQLAKMYGVKISNLSILRNFEIDFERELNKYTARA